MLYSSQVYHILPHLRKITKNTNECEPGEPVCVCVCVSESGGTHEQVVKQQIFHLEKLHVNVATLISANKYKVL